MRCEDGRERLSRLVDGELPAADQAELFGHLESCGECRAFLEDLVRVRGAVRRDREAVLRAADALLPPWPPRPGAAATARAPERRRPAAWLRPALVAPAALALAALLLLAGIGIGSGLTARREAASAAREAAAPRPAPEGPRVVYVCAMPEYVVTESPEPGSGR